MRVHHIHQGEYQSTPSHWGWLLDIYNISEFLIWLWSLLSLHYKTAL